MSDDMDPVFKALADPTRRRLLDRLHARNGLTLGELCERLDMTRQATSQHLAVLESANLVSAVRRGREKLHYLNPVPLIEIQDRWIQKFERSPLGALRAVKRQAEQRQTAQGAGERMAEQPDFVYVIYIEATAERVWDALVDADLTASYWGHSNVSPDWQAGSEWQHVRVDGSGVVDVVGAVVESARPRRLVTTWALPGDTSGRPPSKVTFDVEPFDGIVRLTVTHEGLANDEERADASHGWAAVLSNLKTLLETGHVLPRKPWEAPRG